MKKLTIEELMEVNGGQVTPPIDQTTDHGDPHDDTPPEMLP